MFLSNGQGDGNMIDRLNATRSWRSCEKRWDL